MGLFDFFRKKPAAPPPPSGPYDESGLNDIYEMLFCDRPDLLRKTIQPPLTHPFDLLLSEDADFTALRQLARDEQMESRVRLLANRQLTSRGQQGAGKELLGVVIEMGLEGGLDTLASYKDGTARYINQSGKLLVLEAPDKMTDYLTAELFDASRQVVAKIGPWNQPRRPHPGRGIVRLTFLVSDGLYFGEGPIQGMFEDPMSGPVLNIATQMLQYLTEQASAGEAVER